MRSLHPPCPCPAPRTHTAMPHWGSCSPGSWGGYSCWSTAWRVRLSRLDSPVISRAFYRRFGLFSPSYRGLDSDNDFTTRAYWRSVILDGRSLRLDHRHPTVSDWVSPSESHRRMNRLDEKERAVAQYSAAWPWWKLRAGVRLVPNTSALARTVRFSMVQSGKHYPNTTAIWMHIPRHHNVQGRHNPNSGYAVGFDSIIAPPPFFSLFRFLGRSL